MARRTPIRRSQLLTPFGPGSMFVLQGGCSVIVSSLDYWFSCVEGLVREDGEGNPHSILGGDNMSERWRIHDARLLDALQVDRLHQAPENAQYSLKISGGRAGKVRPQIPVWRFPRWHICPNCGAMTRSELQKSREPECDGISGKEHRPIRMNQTRFLAACPEGHIQDFPWMEWVHRSAHPACEGPLIYRETGAGGLDSITVSCVGCDVKPRNLQGIMSSFASEDETHAVGRSFLSHMLTNDKEVPFLCEGQRPWCGPGAVNDSCKSNLFGILRNGSNVYQSVLMSSLTMPDQLGKADIIQEIITGTAWSFAISFGLIPSDPALWDVEVIYKNERISEILTDRGVTKEDFINAMPKLRGNNGSKPRKILNQQEAESLLRSEEFDALTQDNDADNLLTRVVKATTHSAPVDACFGLVSSVHKLRETRVLYGFQRLAFSGGGSPLEHRHKLWRKVPNDVNWLPATQSTGEGIMLTLNQDRLNRWLSNAEKALLERISPIQHAYNKMAKERDLPPVSLGPTFILLHTLAHLLINRITFACGYSSASLRERLYREEGRLGMLIYTSAGDSEGSLGGLVRMADKNRLGKLITEAVVGATWCSTDPVCMEIVQGAGNCNRAACHACALLPETSCEEFNRFLDRAVVVGTPDAPELGYFSFDGLLDDMIATSDNQDG